MRNYFMSIPRYDMVRETGIYMFIYEYMFKIDCSILTFYVVKKDKMSFKS